MLHQMFRTYIHTYTLRTLLRVYRRTDDGKNRQESCEINKEKLNNINGNSRQHDLKSNEIKNW